MSLLGVRALYLQLYVNLRLNEKVQYSMCVLPSPLLHCDAHKPEVHYDRVCVRDNNSYLSLLV